MSEPTNSNIPDESGETTNPIWFFDDITPQGAGGTSGGLPTEGKGRGAGGNGGASGPAILTRLAVVLATIGVLAGLVLVNNPHTDPTSDRASGGADTPDAAPDSLGLGGAPPQAGVPSPTPTPGVGDSSTNGLGSTVPPSVEPGIPASPPTAEPPPGAGQPTGEHTGPQTLPPPPQPTPAPTARPTPIPTEPAPAPAPTEPSGPGRDQGRDHDGGRGRHWERYDDKDRHEGRHDKGGKDKGDRGRHGRTDHGKDPKSDRAQTYRVDDHRCAKKRGWLRIVISGSWGWGCWR
jgi:hypothetical protein